MHSFFPFQKQLLGSLVLGIDHIGIATNDIQQASLAWSMLLGQPAVDNETLQQQQTIAAFVRPQQNAAVELVCPLPDNKALSRFVEKRGHGLHHIAFAVRDIQRAWQILIEANVPLLDKSPRPGAGGHLVGFLHPSVMGGTLVELVNTAG